MLLMQPIPTENEMHTMKSMGTLLHFPSTTPKCQLLDPGLLSPTAITPLLPAAIVSLQLILQPVLPHEVQTKKLPSCLPLPDAIFLGHLQQQELLAALHQQLVESQSSPSTAAVGLRS